VFRIFKFQTQKELLSMDIFIFVLVPFGVDGGVVEKGRGGGNDEVGSVFIIILDDNGVDGRSRGLAELLSIRHVL